MEELQGNKLLLSVIIIGIIYIFALFIRYIINKRVKDLKIKHLMRRWTYYLMSIIIMITLFIIWLDSSVSITTVLGFTSAGLALALHQVILNIAGWLLIIIRKPYNIGDRIERQNIIGDVIDIRIFYTVVMEVGNWVSSNQTTGRIVQIPNGKIFTEPSYNYTGEFGAIWDEINILITFDSNKEKAEKIILDIAKKLMETKFLEKIGRQQKEMSKRYALKQGKLTPITYFTIKESGIQIELRYLIDVRKERQIKHLIYERIFNQFKQENDIEFAYPSQRVYINE